MIELTSLPFIDQQHITLRRVLDRRAKETILSGSRRRVRRVYEEQGSLPGGNHGAGSPVGH